MSQTVMAMLGAQAAKAVELGYRIKRIRVNPQGYGPLLASSQGGGSAERFAGIPVVLDKRINSYVIEFEDREL